MRAVAWVRVWQFGTPQERTICWHVVAEARQHKIKLNANPSRDFLIIVIKNRKNKKRDLITTQYNTLV